MNTTGISRLNQRFGKLLVVSQMSKRSSNGTIRWKCRCDCGHTTIVSGSDLKRQNCCEHCKHLAIGVTNKKHGDIKTFIYRKWIGIRQRCNDKNNSHYADYGGRGIKICAEWDNYEKFRDHVKSLPNCPDCKNNLYSLDRINNNKGYEPENVKWSISVEQMNNRRTTLYLVYGQELITIANLARKINKSYLSCYRKFKKRSFTLDG